MADKYSDLIGGVNLPIDITPVVNEAAARKARGELDALGKDATIKVDVDAKGLKEAQAQLSQLNKLESENTKLVQSNTNAVRQNTKAIADNNKAANAKTTTHTNNKTTDVNKVARQFDKLKENKQNLEGFISSISNEIAGLTEVFGKLDADWSWEDHMPGSEEGELEDQVKALQKAWHDAGKMLNNLSKNKSVDTSKYRNAVFNYVKSLKEYVWGFNLADYLLQSEWGEEYGGEKLRDDIESEIDSFILKDKSNKATIQTIASKLKTVMKSMDEAIEGKITQKIKNQLNSLAENVDRYVMSIGGDTSGLSPEELKVLSAAQGYISKNKQHITTKNSKVQDDIIKDSYKQFDINNNSELSFITKSIKEAEKELEVINSEINVLSDQFGGIVNGISSLEEAINIAAKNNISSDKTKQLAEKYVEDFTYLRELLTFLDGNAMLSNKPSDYYSPESIKLINASYAEFSSALELFNTLAGNPETEEKKLQAMAVYVTKAYESFKYLADRSDANFYEVFKEFGLSSDAVVYMVDGIPSQITKITKSLRDAKDELYFQFYKDFPQLATDIGSGNLQAYSKKSYDDFIKRERDISEGKYYEILESASNAIDNTINKSEVIESLNDLSRSVSIQQHKISDMGDTASNVANSLSKMMEITDAHNRTEEEKYLVTSSNKKVKQKTLTSRELAGTLFSDGSISYTSSEHNGHADEYEMLVSMFDNLFSDAVMSLHTHPYRRYNDQISESWGFSTSDIIGALGDSKMGNKLTGVLSGKILQVMDVSNFTEDLRLELIEQIKNISKQWFDNNKYPDLFNYTKDEKHGYYSLENKPKNNNVDYEKQIEKYDEFLQEVLSKVGLQDHIKTYNLSDTQQFNEAVKYISKFAEQSKTDLIDTERFSKLLNSYADIKGYGSDRRKQIDTTIKDYSEGIITAQEGFAKIMGKKIAEMGRIAISQQENKQDEKQNDRLSNSRSITPNRPLYTQTQLEYEQAVLDKIKQLYTDNIQQVSKVWNEVFTYNPLKKQTFTDALSYGDSTVQVGQRGDVRVYNKKLMMVEKDFSNFEDKIKKAVDYLYRVGVTLDSTIAGIYPPGYQEQMKQIEAERKTQEEQTKNKVVKNTLEESTKNAINKLKDYEKLYDQVSMKVFHGSKVALDNVDYDPSKTQGQKKLGEGLYTTPDIELAVKHGQNLLEIQTNLNNAFVLSEDKITSLTNLYKAMGKELPEVMPKDQFWKKIKSDLMEATSTPKGAKQFSENMKAMGYQGMYSKGYGYADSNIEQLVIYDEEFLKGLSTQSASILAERYPQIKKETKVISENTKAWSENASEISGRKGELQQEIKLTEVQITKLKEEQQELENLVNGISKFLDPNTAAQWINNKITDNDLKKSIKDTAALESKRLNNTAYQAQLSQQYGSAGSSVGTLKAARAWFEATRVYKDGALTKTLDKQFPNALNLYNKSNLQGEIDKVKTVQRAINEKLVALNAKFAKQQQELNDLNRGILKEDTQSNNKQQVVTKEQIKPEQKTTNNIPVQENKTTISEVKKQEAEIKKQEDVVKKVNKQLEVQNKQEQEISDKSKETTAEKEKQVEFYEEIVQRQQQLQQTDPNKDVVTTPVTPQEVENKKEELEIEQEITKEKEKQRQVTEETVKVHRKVRREPITSSDESSKDTKKKQTKKEIDEVNPAISGLISQTLDDALSTLANAKDNKTTLFDFGKINTQEDLQRVAKDFVNEIANQAHMAVKNVKVDGRQILATLYDEMLKVTVKQTYTLTRGKQDEPPKLRLTGQSYSQNVQAYTNGNAFDVEEGLQKAIDAVEKLKKSVHGLKYDFSDLDASATAVNSLDTWNDFTNKLKETQEKIQLIKSSISSKGSSNLFAAMQKDMQNSDIELKKIQTKLDGFGNIKGIEDANSMLDKMFESVKKFNDAFTPEEQVNAYNQYNETNERLKKQIDLLNETERTIKKQQQEQKKQGEANDSTKTITAQYQELYNVIQKINNINNDIMKYQSKNDGSGIFTQLIAGLKSDKASLQNELNSIINTLNQKEVFEFGDKIYAPFESSTLNGSQFESVVNFINDIGTQAVISEKNIDKLVDSLKSAAEIDVNAKSQLQNLFISYSQMQQKIFQNQGLEDLKGDYKLTLANRSNEIETLFSQIDGDWTSEHVGHLKQLISEYTEYGNTITSIAEKEKQYFEGKQKYKYTYQASDGKEKTGYFTNQDKQANNIKEYLEYQKQLESAAREIAKEQYNIDKVFVTGYSKDKNGIARLDFSGWNEDLKTLQTFRAEMGSVTEGIYVTAQSVNKTFESISNAQKQMGNTSGLLEILKSSGINLDADNATRSVSKLVTILDQLQTAISADVPDSNLINKLTKDLKMSTSEVEAAYKRMSQVQDMIDSGTSKYSSSQISTSTPEAVQNSATQVIREYAAACRDANIENVNFSEGNNKVTFSLITEGGEIRKCTGYIDQLSGKMAIQENSVSKVQKAIYQTTSSYDQFKNVLGKTAKQLMVAFVGYNVFYKVISQIRTGIGYVKEIDLAMTELKKVTDESANSYKNFTNVAYESAGKVGATVSDFINASADFARLGYSINEAGKMAETAIVYKNVADGMDSIEQSTESIISTMKAFGIEAENTMSIADKFNEVGNNFAISSAGIGDALTRSASALAAGGNTLDESIALITGANTVVQDPDVVGTALKTLSLRIRGVKTELEEAGLDAENMAETTSTLQAKLLALSHGRVDVMKNADEFKSTTEILRELADAWEHMTDVEQAAAIELVAGKRQANIVASLMTNFDTVEKAIETSMNSEGSAVKENEKYLESIAGKTEALTRSMEEFWNRLVNSNVIKFFIDLARQVVNTANTIGPFTSSVIALVAALSSIKNINILTVFKDMFVHFKTLGASINNLSLLSKSITQAANISSVGQLGVLDATQVTRYAQAVAGLTPNLQASRLAMAGLNQEQIRQVLTANNVTQAQMQQAMSQREVTRSIIENGAAENSVLITETEVTAFKKDQTISNYLLTMSNQQLTASMVMQAVSSGRLTAQQAQQIITTLGLTSAEGGLAVATNSASIAVKGLGASLKALFLSNPIGWILLLGSTVAMLVSRFTQAKQSSKDLIQSVENVKTEYKQAVDEIQNSVKTVNDLEDEFTKLSKGVNAAGENISLSLDDYKRYQEIVKTLIDLNPNLVSGYNSQGQAIINNNKAIQETIDLLKQKQQLEAKEASKYENNENARKSVEAQVDEATHDFNVNGGKVATLDAGVQKATNAIYDTIMSDLRYDPDDWENAVQIETEYVNEFLRMIGSQAKVEIDENGVPIEYIRETLSTEIEANYDQIIEDLRSGNSRLAAFFGQESADELMMLQADYESKLNTYNTTIENARKQLNEQILTNLKASEAYWNLEDETTRSYVESYIDGLDVNEDNFYGKLDEAKQFISWISIKQEEVSKLIGKAAYAKSGTDENGAEVTFAEYQKNIQAIVDDINNSNYSDTQKNWLLQMLGLDDTTLLRINQEMDHVNGLMQRESEKVKKEKADQLTGATQAVKDAQAEFKEAERKYNETLNEAEAAGYTNFSTRKFGNVDTDKVKAITWDETAFNESKSQLESWEYTLDQLQGTTSTVLGMWDGFDLGDTTLDIAFTPMLQTDEGVKILSPDEIDSYIGGLIDELKSSGKDWTNEDLIALDARGVVKDGVLIKNIIADVGETASHTSEIMHFAGQDGAIALARRNVDESRKAVEEAQNQLKHVQSDSYDEIEAWKQSLTASDLELLYTISADANSMTLDQMQDKLLELKQNSGAHITPAITYDKLTDSLDGYNNAVSQTNAILSDNTRVTSEYKDSLIALGIEESTLKEYFYEDNELVVKNAEGLNKLVKATKNNVLTNTKLAKSQAMLKYNQLQQRAHALASKYRNLTAAEKEELNTLYQEMSMLQKSIAKYSLLEHTLLGATTAYEKFAEAQDIDASNTYTEQAQNMVSALSEAFYTAKLGTETAQAAIEGLIPESVFADADTLDDKMQKIYDYFTGGELTKYFSIEFDDDGKVSEVEMKLENVENFFNEGKDRGIFTGTWDEFDLDPAIKSLDELADKMGVTKEVAFSVLSEMEKYDINWLGGDNTTLLDKLTSDSLEMRLYATSSAMAELDQQYTSGSIDAVQYRQNLAELEQQMSSLGTEAVTKANNYLDLEKRVTEVSNELTEAQKALADAQAEVDKNKDNKSAQKALEEQTELVVELAQKYQDLKKEQDALGTISELEMATALQALGVDINNINESLKETKNKMLEIFNDNMFDSGSLQIFKDHLRETYDIVRAIDENGNATISITNITSEEDRAELAKIGELQEDGSINITTMYQGLTPEQREQIDQLAALQDKQELINFYMEMNGQDPVQSALDGIKEVLENIYKQLSEGATLSVSTTTAQNNINRLKYTLDTFKNTNYDKTINVRTYEYTYQATKGTQVQGPTKWQGNAYAQGKFGAPVSEQSLVGELGPEMVVRGNQWFTVGDNGAEFFDVKKDDIIFNHKQTEQILKNGHINSRGQAYAQGTAYAGINTWTGGYNGGSNSNNNNSNTSDNLSDAASDLSDAAEEFKEVFDWFEVKLEEINELLELMGAQLENIVDISGKNQKINSIIEENKYKVSILAQGLKLYEDYANKLLAEVPEQYRDAAQNGKIAIEEFTGEVGEKTLEAINNYREWAKKVADVQQQMEELVQTIADLAKQKFDVIDDGYGNELSLVADQIDRIKDAISLTEKKGYISSTRYYKEMGILTQQRLDSLKEEHDLLKESLDESVLAGDIQKYSEQWYDMVSAINDVDDEINDCLSDLEEFQNAINDIYWSNFDQLITNLDYFKTETQNLIDLMEKSGDIVKDLSKEKDFWSAKEVEWTSEGLASLGLYAQQMEIAEYKTKQYENAIKSLSQDYEDGKYSVNEYQEKLSELKDAQYESIQNYYEAQEAIVSLNKTRVEAIKTGINKEIEAYEKLIKKKKEELTTEKNLYDFQKNVSKQQKSISEIERKISALSGDYSTSAVAQRKKLEAELLEAKKELEETYYDRSISDQQDALDNELNNFKEQKEEEIKKWEQYLADVETVITDSLNLVQENALNIYETLIGTSDEYGLTLSDSVVTPWKNGTTAISNYQETFNTASSETCKSLDEIRDKWQSVIDLMVLAGDSDIINIKTDNESHMTPQVKTESPTSTSNSSSNTTTNSTQAQSSISVSENETSQPSTEVGSTVVVKTTATQFATGQKMASFVPGGSYTVYKEDGDKLLIGKDGAYTGWVYKKDIQGYAKGTTGLKKNQLAIVDELGEELVLHAGENGKLQFLTKGTSVIPADITENLMTLGKIDPQEMLNRNRASIGVDPSIVNNNVTIDISYGDILHIDNFDGTNPDEIAKIVSKEFDAQQKKLNDSLRRFAR